MSLSGTILAVKKGETIGFIHKPSLVRGDDKIIEKLIFGSGDAGNSSPFRLYKCDDTKSCLKPEKSTKETMDFGIEDTMLYKVTKIISTLSHLKFRDKFKKICNYKES